MTQTFITFFKSLSFKAVPGFFANLVINSNFIKKCVIPEGRSTALCFRSARRGNFRNKKIEGVPILIVIANP